MKKHSLVYISVYPAKLPRGRPYHSR